MKKGKNIFLGYYKIIFFIIFLISILVLMIFYVKNHIITEGKFNKNIVFGQSCALTKNNSDKGERYSLGYILAFQKQNMEGGINNRNIELIVYDDEYNPKIAVDNVKILIGYFDVFAIIGSVGTPTAAAIQEYIIDKKVPFIQPISGSSLLRKFNENILFSTTSYYNEINIILDYLKKNKKNNLGIIYQNDELGLSTLSNLYSLLTLNKYNNFNIISHSSYEHSSIIIDNAISNLLNIKNIYNKNEIQNSKILKNIEVVILFSVSEQATMAINYLKFVKPDIYICIISSSTFSDIEKIFLKNTNINTNNIYLSHPLPDFSKKNPKLLKEIKEEMDIYKKYAKIHNDIYNEKKISPIIIEGYLNGLFIINILKNIKNYTRKDFIDEIYKKHVFNIEGLTYGPYYTEDDCKDINNLLNCPCNSGLRSVYLYQYSNKNKTFNQIYEINNLNCNI